MFKNIILELEKVKSPGEAAIVACDTNIPYEKSASSPSCSASNAALC